MKRLFGYFCIVAIWAMAGCHGQVAFAQAVDCYTWNTQSQSWVWNLLCGPGQQGGQVIVPAGKLVQIKNSLTLLGTDGASLNVGAGGTLGSAAFTAASAYQASSANLSLYAAIAPSANVQTFLGAANYAAMLSLLGGQPALAAGTGISISGGTISTANVPNAALANSSITIAGNATALGGSVSQDSITGLSSTGLVKRTAANTLGIATAGTDYSTPSAMETLTNKSMSGSSNTFTNIPNSALSNNSITVAGNSTAFGGSVSQDSITGLSSTGIIKRTGANTLGIATAGTDYQAPLASTSITIAGNATALGGSVSQDSITGLSSTGLVKRTAANTLGIATAGTDYSTPSATETLTNKTIAAGSNTITGLTNSNLSGSAGITNANLANNSISIAGNATALGGSVSQDSITGLSSTGIIRRTGTNTLGIASAGTDYQTPLASTSITIAGNATSLGGSVSQDSITGLSSTGLVKRTAANTLGIALNSDLPVFGASGSSHASGAVPDPGSSAGSTRYLREDGTWNTPSGGSGGVSTQNVVTGSRTFGAVYHNTTGKPMFVNISVYGGTNPSIVFYSDSSSSPSTLIAQVAWATNDVSPSVGFWVLAGNYYEAVLGSGSPTIAAWVETY
jgi:hypothetical protein